MSKSEKADFPVVNMPRMGRRNAIAYPSRILNDGDDGAFSPINLLNRASVSDIDPQGVISTQLKLERRSQVSQKSRGSISVTPITSVLDGWKKLHDAKNGSLNGIERLFEPVDSQVSGGTTNLDLPLGMPVVAPVQRTKKALRANVSPGQKPEKEVPDAIATHRVNPIIPWKKQSTNKQPTLAEERRKLFESFDMTSIEPPETPQVSELTLRKSIRRTSRRRKNGKDLRSESSMGSGSAGKGKDNKAPFSNITPKVNTRWDKIEETVQQAAVKGQPAPDHGKEKEAKAKVIATPLAVNDSEKPSSNRGKNPTKPLAAVPLKAQASKTEKLGATETAKNTTDKLPLTIGPRYNPRKVLGFTTNDPRLNTNKNRTDTVNEVSNRLYGTLPAHQQKAKLDEQHHRPTGNSMRSTFFNLQRINNAGAPSQKRGNSVGQILGGRQSASALGSPGLGGPPKKPTPIVQTIQAPPSPFLTSKISVQSQMNEIPINGERYTPHTPGPSKAVKRDGKDAAKPGRLQNKPKTPVNTKTNPAGPSVVAAAPPPKNTLGPQASQISQGPPKVVPTLGPLPNKYNNIYIGPYSGSDSEGESSKKR